MFYTAIYKLMTKSESKSESDKLETKLLITFIIGSILYAGAHYFLHVTKNNINLYKKYIYYICGLDLAYLMVQYNNKPTIEQPNSTDNVCKLQQGTCKLPQNEKIYTENEVKQLQQHYMQLLNNQKIQLQQQAPIQIPMQEPNKESEHTSVFKNKEPTVEKTVEQKNEMSVCSLPKFKR